MAMWWWIAATLWMSIGRAQAPDQPPPCICKDEDPVSIFSRAEKAFIARSGDLAPSELEPLMPLKGELPRRAYISNTWRPCDLPSAMPNELKLIIQEEKGFISRCNGSGPLPGGSNGAIPTSTLRAWLQFGSWSDEKIPKDVVMASIRRELNANELRPEEDGVAVTGYPGLEEPLEGNATLRSLQARTDGPRWMKLESLSDPSGELYYIRWEQEVTTRGRRAVWESQTLLRVTPVGTISLWRVETSPTPVLEGTDVERVATETLQRAPSLVGFPNGDAVALIPGARLYAPTSGVKRGWSHPEAMTGHGAAHDAPLAPTSTGAVSASVAHSPLHTRTVVPW